MTHINDESYDRVDINIIETVCRDSVTKSKYGIYRGFRCLFFVYFYNDGRSLDARSLLN